MFVLLSIILGGLLLLCPTVILKQLVKRDKAIIFMRIVGAIFIVFSMVSIYMIYTEKIVFPLH